MGLLNRELTDAERVELERRARTRKGSVRAAERARIILAASHYDQWTWLARNLGLDRKTVRLWVERFEQNGLAGLSDASRSGHPFVYTEFERSTVVQLALTPPRELGLPFGSWTFDRLETFLNERCHIQMSRSRIHALLVSEGMRWRKEEGWIGARLDPDFLKKRGTLTGHT